MLWKMINFIRGGSATSKIELFVIIVNGYQPLTIVTKCSILDVAAVLDPLLFIEILQRRAKLKIVVSYARYFDVS